MPKHPRAHAQIKDKSPSNWPSESGINQNMRRENTCGEPPEGFMGFTVYIYASVKKKKGRSVVLSREEYFSVCSILACVYNAGSTAG